MKKIFLFMLALCATSTAVVAASKASKPTKINLWQRNAPHRSEDVRDTAWVKVFLPSKNPTGRAIVVCPGGGYSHLAMQHEGEDWAPFFNNMGIATIVLHYRMPHGNKEIPIEDAEQAMRLVRLNARAWKINPDDIGIMGSSAGGHLASTIATHSKGDAKPNFQILFYPVITMDPEFTHKGSHDNFLGSNASKKSERQYSNDTQINDRTPRTWIALADDDTVVPPANGFNYYFECYRHDVPASMHVYPCGGHGFGIRPSFEFHEVMMLELKSWLQSF